MSNVGFLEYSFNPQLVDSELIYSNLNNLGFIHRNQHKSNLTGFWIQHSAIILLRQTDQVQQPTISGIGLIVPEETITAVQPIVDPNNDMYVCSDGGGLRVLLSTSDQINSLLANGYDVVDRKDYDLPGLEYFSGMVYNCFDQKVLDFYCGLGFKIAKMGENYITLLSSENRFSLLINKHSNMGKVSTVVCDTMDVFRTTSCYAVAGINTRPFHIDRASLNFGNKLNHKIVGYNCAAFGNEQSYTIENYIDLALPNLDLIFRTRKHYPHITEQTLNYYAVTRSHVPPTQ
jgi:hypothetical protein